MALKKEDVADIYALSNLQEGMLFHYLKNENAEYNEQIILDIKGNIQYGIFKQACQRLTQKYEVLRTVFNWEVSKAHLQIVLKKLEPETKYVDYSGENAPEEKTSEYAQADVKTRFDLKERAIRYTLVKQAEEQYAIIITNHHIIYDGWSNGILIRSLLEEYEKCQKNDKGLVEVSFPYKKYIQFMKQRDKSKEEVYWSGYLEGFVPYLEKQEEITSLSQEETAYLDKDSVECFLREQNITLAVFMNTAWGILQHKIERKQDIIFGTTVSGRNARELNMEEAVGLFINTIPLRMTFDSQITVQEMLKKMQKDMVNRTEYEYTSITDIKKIAGMANYDELFRSIVVVENYPLDNSRLGEEFELTGYQTYETNHYDLTIGIEMGRQIRIVFSYKESAYTNRQVRSLLESYQQIIMSMIMDPQQKVKDIEMVTQEKKKRMLEQVNSRSEYNFQHQNIVQMFREAVLRFENRIAVKLDDRAISYRELDERSDKLAKILIGEGIESNQVIPVLMHHSIEMIVAMFAVIKSGAAFTLLDKSMPVERIRNIVKDCNASVLISDYAASGYCSKTVIYNSESPIEDRECELPRHISPADLLYIIYTSGTTGVPQGVQIEHRNLVAYIEGVTKELSVSEQDSTIQLCAVTFDTFIDEVFLPLLNGGKLVLVKAEDMKNVHKLHELIQGNKISILSCVPMLLHAFNNMERMESVRIIISGGDILKHGNISNYIGHADIYNSYGPSEATIAPLYYKLDKAVKENMSIPIGIPLAGASCYILDPDGKVCNYGIPGEIYLGGASIGRGYVNNEKRTRQRFVNRCICEKQEYLYKTNDLGVLQEDGNVLFIGRDDGQVKVNGVRVELNEVEFHIRKHAGIKDVNVTMQKSTNNRKVMCAFYVAERHIEAKELRKYLSTYLPAAMIPAVWIELEEIPLSRHGKIDDKKLQERFLAEQERKRQNRVACADEKEEAIWKLWKEVLNTSDFGVMDDFFEIGGDSLKLTSLYTLIKQQVFEEVSVQNLFDYRTIRELCDYFKSKDEQPKKEMTVIEF